MTQQRRWTAPCSPSSPLQHQLQAVHAVMLAHPRQPPSRRQRGHLASATLHAKHPHTMRSFHIPSTPPVTTNLQSTPFFTINSHSLPRLPPPSLLPHSFGNVPPLLLTARSPLQLTWPPSRMILSCRLGSSAVVDNLHLPLSSSIEPAVRWPSPSSIYSPQPRPVLSRW